MLTRPLGWGGDWRAGVLTDDEILARLFALNQARGKARPAVLTINPD